MKASIFIKACIVIIALSLLGYIIYQNNQATEITELVTNPIEKYDFLLHCDSVNKVIQKSTYQDAKSSYLALYEEIDVYATIVKTDHTTFVSDSVRSIACGLAMQSFWPILQDRADNT